eukprot:COSAG02_NODE_10809_length_1854_cov_1.212536_1_plen_206_part_10
MHWGLNRSDGLYIPSKDVGVLFVPRRGAVAFRLLLRSDRTAPRRMTRRVVVFVHALVYGHLVLRFGIFKSNEGLHDIGTSTEARLYVPDLTVAGEMMDNRNEWRGGRNVRHHQLCGTAAMSPLALCWGASAITFFIPLVPLPAVLLRATVVLRVIAPIRQNVPSALLAVGVRLASPVTHLATSLPHPTYHAAISPNRLSHRPTTLL